MNKVIRMTEVDRLLYNLKKGKDVGLLPHMPDAEAMIKDMTLDQKKFLLGIGTTYWRHKMITSRYGWESILAYYKVFSDFVKESMKKEDKQL